MMRRRTTPFKPDGVIPFALPPLLLLLMLAVVGDLSSFLPVPGDGDGNLFCMSWPSATTLGSSLKALPGIHTVSARKSVKRRRGDAPSKSTPSQAATVEIAADGEPSLPTAPGFTHAPAMTSVFERDLVSAKPTYSSILNNHDVYHVETATQRFSGETLAYVTPWNNHGYDVAKVFAGKFTYVSPVWLQIRQASSGAFEITGLHDADEGWMTEVRAGCSQPAEHCPQILPRVVWEARQVPNKQLIDLIVSTCLERGFDGVVLEFAVAHRVLDWVKQFSKAMRSEKGVSGQQLKLVYVVTPNLEQFTPEMFADMVPLFDRFSLMTYDYSSSGPESPLPWMRQVVRSLVSKVAADKRAAATSQILLGLPLYGYDSGEAVVRHQYLDLLRQHKPKILRDTKANEHYFTYKKGGRSKRVYYPTLYFIQTRLEEAESLGTGISLWEIGQGLDYFYDLL